MTGNNMRDDELDRLLSAATRPTLPEGAATRLIARLEREPGANVVAFKPPTDVRPRSRMVWLSGLPLAASLVLGLYLGSAGEGAGLLPDFAYDVLGETTDEAPVTGIEDAESLAEDDVS